MPVASHCPSLYVRGVTTSSSHSHPYLSDSGLGTNAPHSLNPGHGINTRWGSDVFTRLLESRLKGAAYFESYIELPTGRPPTARAWYLLADIDASERPYQDCSNPIPAAAVHNREVSLVAAPKHDGVDGVERVRKTA